ncbi:MAG: EAL domain-containing protein [Chroococcidiopsidaceae cyanobacterium CP_BM_ER_R8_30]|nr:EAL domain-containing protein [Chroococcidiopsidaceae cyanobacterium CP_BM_ER_R8_30]
MNFDELGQLIEKLRLQLAALQQHTDSELACQQLFRATLEELLAGFARLTLAKEELHRQQEELEIARMAVERECQIANQEDLGLVQTPAKLGSFEWDLQTNIIIRSKELEALYGLKPGEFGQRRDEWTRYVHPDDLTQAEIEFQKSLITGEWYSDFRVIWPDSSIHWLQVRAKVFFDEAGKPLRVIGVDEDITDRKQAEAALQESEAKFRLLIQNSSDIISIVNLGGTILYVSPSVTRILGYNPEEMLGKNVFEFIHAEDSLKSLNTLSYLIQTEGTTTQIECRVRRQDGSWCFLESTSSNLLVEPSVMGIVVNSRDLTERKVAEERLLHAALYDALTGLPNRTLFMERLQHAVEYAKRHKDFLFAVLFLDLDRFKFINDSFGHSFGDQFLLHIAESLRTCLRSVDVAARLGGDEFAILLEGIRDISDAVRVATRLQQQLSLPITLGRQQLSTTVSIGIALSTISCDQPEDLLRNADIAMYRAKAQGNARCEIFNMVMHLQVVERLHLERELRRAIELQEFRVHYQPIVSLTTGRITGFEALVRWEHPEKGQILPAKFIPLAEETGLIAHICQLVLRIACTEMRSWQLKIPVALPFKLSVNLSSKQLAQPDLVDQIQQILQESGLEAASLRLELTESGLMESTQAATKMLELLRDLGVQLTIDDFGTGYSSLSRLHHFPINGLKIDRSFVFGLGLDPRNTEIVSTIVTLAHRLGVDVTAEGVETLEQLTLLRAMKCEYGQGYFFSKPLDSCAAEALIVANPHHW